MDWEEQLLSLIKTKKLVDTKAGTKEIVGVIFVEQVKSFIKQNLINARIEGAIREIVRLTILMSDGTSVEEYQKALSILHKEKIMLREELKKEKTNG